MTTRIPRGIFSEPETVTVLGVPTPGTLFYTDTVHTRTPGDPTIRASAGQRYRAAMLGEPPTHYPTVLNGLGTGACGFVTMKPGEEAPFFMDSVTGQIAYRKLSGGSP